MTLNVRAQDNFMTNDQLVKFLKISWLENISWFDSTTCVFAFVHGGRVDTSMGAM